MPKRGRYFECFVKFKICRHKIQTFRLASSLAAAAPSPQNPGPPGRCNWGKWEKRKCTRGLPESQRPPSAMQKAVRLFVSSNVAEIPRRHENLKKKTNASKKTLSNCFCVRTLLAASCCFFVSRSFSMRSTSGRDMESKLDARALLKAVRSGWLRRFEVVSRLSRDFLYLETSSLKRKFGKIWSAESRVKLHLGHLEEVWWIRIRSVPGIWIPMHLSPAGLLYRLKKTVVAESVTTSERGFKII